LKGYEITTDIKEFKGPYLFRFEDINIRCKAQNRSYYYRRDDVSIQHKVGHPYTSNLYRVSIPGGCTYVIRE